MKRINKENVKSILLISLSNLGDIILTTPVLDKLCNEFSGAEIDVVTSVVGKEVFASHNRVAKVIVYKKRQNLRDRIRFIKDLRIAKYDLVIDLKNSFLPYLIGSKYRSSLISSTIFSLKNIKKSLHKKDEHLSKIIPFVKDSFKDSHFFVPIREKDKEFIHKILESVSHEHIVIISPGAKSHLKRWDAKKYALLSDRLVSELGCKVFVVGNDDDLEVVDKFLLSAKEPVTDLCGKTSIGALSLLMKRAALVITNDSAPLHIASSVNAHVIAIFGPTDEKKYGPLSKLNRVIKPIAQCRPCEEALCKIGPDEGCIQRITVEEVFEKAKEFFQNKWE